MTNRLATIWSMTATQGLRPGAHDGRLALGPEGRAGVHGAPTHGTRAYEQGQGPRTRPRP